MNFQLLSRRAPLWGMIVLPLLFALCLMLLSLDARVRFQFDLDGSRRNLFNGFWFVLGYGLAFELACASVLGALTRIFLRREVRLWRALTRAGSVLSLLFLIGMLARNWRYDEAYPLPPATYPVDVPVVLGLALPILWALGLFLMAVTARSAR